MFILHPGNLREHVQRCVDLGYQLGCLPRQTAVGSILCAPPADEVFPAFPQNEWIDRHNAMKGRYAFDLMRAAGAPVKDQGRLNFCWGEALTQGVEADRVGQGLPYVELAAESLAGAVNCKNAGYSIDSAAAYAAAHGIARRELVPLWSINPSQWQGDWKADALLHCPTKYRDLDGKNVWANTVTAILCGRTVAAGIHWGSGGHALCYGALDLVDGQLVPVARQSWGPGYGEDGYFVLAGGTGIPTLGAIALLEAKFSRQ
jgi:hypothetical protein